MTTKHIAGILAISAAALTTAHASFELSPGTNLFLTGTASAKYNDNIFLASNGEKSSGVIDIQPGFSLEMGSAALTQNIFTYSEDFVTYTDASSQNTELAQVQYNVTYSDSKLTMKLNAGYHQLAQNSRDIRANGVIVHTDMTNITPTGEVIVSPKTTLGAGVDYENTHYNAAGFDDVSSYAIPLNAYYEIEPKLQASVGYRYRHNDVDHAADSDDNYISVGARGDFDPKVKGTFSVGYNERSVQAFTLNGVHTGSYTETSIGLDANLEYTMDEKTKFNFTAKNDFANAATGATQKVFSLGGSVISKLSEVLSADGSLNYGNFKYVGSSRVDDFYQAHIGLTYSLNKAVKFNGAYDYQDNSSNLSGSSFTDNVFSVAVIVRY
jgi:hypothetical protein